MKLPLADIAAITGASNARLSGHVSTYSIDSRTAAEGDLFFALRGENFDGHDFVADVLAKGAAAAVVDRAVAVNEVSGDRRLIIVPDVLAALQRLASQARLRWGGVVVAVTGSAGKTSTKDVIAAVLANKFRTGKAAGNLNNHIGLPLSILRLPDESEAAVLELGMNHAGEIRELAGIAKPNIGVVTNVGYAHIESFGSIDDIGLAKRELVESLDPSGVAVLNADDPRVLPMASVHPGRSVLYGLSEAADVRATAISSEGGGSSFTCLGQRFTTSLTGQHSIRNILAAIAVAREMGIDPASLGETVGQLQPGKMRGERLASKGIQIINDCYNSNPDAARAMLEVLRDIPAGRHVAVLGEMLELGHWAEPLHRDVGRYAVRCGVDVLVGIRGGARFTVEAATEAGLAENAAYFFEDPNEAGVQLRSIAKVGDAILFKGSRGTRVEKALESFLG